jgi:hypothetical protein
MNNMDLTPSLEAVSVASDTAQQENLGVGCNIRALQKVVECIELIRETLHDRIGTNNNVELAKSLLRHLSELRSLLNAGDNYMELIDAVIKTNFIELIMSHVTIVLRYENVTDECLRVIAPLTRITSADTSVGSASVASEEVIIQQRQLMYQIFRSGGVVFTLLALRGYMNTSLGIRLQGLEILSSILEYVALTVGDDANNATKPDVDDNMNTTAGTGTLNLTQARPVSPGGTRYDYQGAEVARYFNEDVVSSYSSSSHRQKLREIIKLPVNSLAQDCVHQMLLHGAGVILVRLLQYSLAASSEIAARRSIWCIRFLLLDTPPSLAAKVAKYDHYACVTALAPQLQSTSKLARVEAAVLLTAMLSADVEVCGVLTSIGGWDDMSSVLAQNAELVHVPAHWLQGSLENIKKLDSGLVPVNASATARKTPKGVPAVRNNGADEISAVETALLSSTQGEGSFEDILHSLLKNTNQSARDRAGRWSRPGSRNSSSRPASRSGTMPRSASQNIVGTKYANIPTMMNTTQSAQALHGADDSNQHRPRSRGKFNIQNSNFAKNLKESPLGQPVDPEMLKKVKKANGGKIPQHVPHALGGPKLGSRPGPDYGSKVKKPKVLSSGLGQSPSPSRPHSAHQHTFAPLATTNELHPTPGKHVSINSQLEEEKRKSIKVAKQANFIAKKLFDATTENVPEVEPNRGSATAVEKLNFAERLQCMIMQVSEMN